MYLIYTILQWLFFIISDIEKIDNCTLNNVSLTAHAT